jgi:hypothetical protein
MNATTNCLQQDEDIGSLVYKLCIVHGRTVLFWQDHGVMRVIVRTGLGGHDYPGTVAGLREALTEVQSGVAERKSQLIGQLQRETDDEES